MQAEKPSTEIAEKPEAPASVKPLIASDEAIAQAKAAEKAATEESPQPAKKKAKKEKEKGKKIVTPSAPAKPLPPPPAGAPSSVIAFASPGNYAVDGAYANEMKEERWRLVRDDI